MANTGYQILKYTVDQADALATAVAGLAATGWLPQGGAAIGGVKAAVVQADSAAAVLATLVTDFNALLAKLKTSGAMASS